MKERGEKTRKWESEKLNEMKQKGDQKEEKRKKKENGKDFFFLTLHVSIYIYDNKFGKKLLVISI